MRYMETTLLTGVVQSGGPTDTQPIPNINVTIFEATADTPVHVGSARTNSDGEFEFHLDRNTSERIFYASAAVSQDVQLVTIIGPSLHHNFPAWITAGDVNAGSTASIVINELTTVAAAFSMAQFTRDGLIGGDAFGLRIASLMNDNLVSPQFGVISEVLLNPPNADQTNSLRSLRSLANLLAACVRGVSNAITDLFALTTPPYGGPAPTNTFQAMVNIAHYPANNVAGIYTQSQQVGIYSPALESPPNAWTLAVKVNNTGSNELLFGGVGNIAFDERGYAWITNNVVQGTPNSSHFAVVLKPNGKPADGTPTTPWENPDGLPTSPLLGGGLLGGGFGVAVDNGEHTNGFVWLGNYGWGTQDHWPAEGGVSLFTPAGVPLSNEPTGFVGGTLRVQGVAIDSDNNIWMASYGNNQIVVFLKGDPRQPVTAATDEGYAPFDVAIDRDGSAWVTTSTGLYEYTEGRIAHFHLDTNHKELLKTFSNPLGRGLKGLSIDSLGNIWVAAGGINAVCLLDKTGKHIGTFGSKIGEPWGGINGPWGTTIDGDDHVWVANFGQMVPGANYTDAAVTKLAGANPDTRPPGFETGDPISPPSGYTLPSGGDPVTLPNGDPLYGCGADASFSPLMRQTNCSIDQAGNVWVCNNWKPDFDTDFSPSSGNPGGDGIVIFVGLAKPPART
jgi:hypothetical protein